jgi:hypothetical protein
VAITPLPSNFRFPFSPWPALPIGILVVKARSLTDFSAEPRPGFVQFRRLYAPAFAGHWICDPERCASSVRQPSVLGIHRSGYRALAFGSMDLPLLLCSVACGRSGQFNR